MNRRSFLGAIGALLTAPFAAKAADKPVPSRQRVCGKAGPRVGLIDAQVRSGDWLPLLDGKRPPKEHIVVAVDDINGWYEYIDERDTGRLRDGEWWPRYRVYGNISVRYTGDNPRWQHLKD